jgi:uncharacterized OB-fold protein
MAEERVDVIAETVALPYTWTTGPTLARFLQGLKEGKILGTRCPQCRRVLVPARLFCPRCFVDTTEWVDLPDSGRLRTYTIVNFRYAGQPKEPPYVVGIIDLEGAGVGLLHWVGGVDLSDLEAAGRRLRTGLPVKAVWARERRGRITDIDHFAPGD